MTKQFSNYSDLLTFTRASKGHALRPVSYGDELVTNGGFDTDSDWTKGTGWTISGGAAVSNNASGYGDVRQDLSLTANKIYRLEFSVTSYTSGVVKPYLGNSGNSLAEPYGSGNLTAGLTADSAGDFYAFFVYDASQLSQILFRSNNGFVGSIDNISVKEVTFDESDGTLTLFEHPNNIPRVEWDADRNRLGLLVEEARTNLVTDSQDFSASSWTKTNTATLSLDSVGPDGQANSAVKLIDNSATGTGVVRVFDNVGVSTSTDYTFSVYAKADQLSKVLLFTIGFTTPSNNGYIFDLNDGTYTAYSGTPALTPSVEYVGNGWYRCSITFTTDATDTSGSLAIYAYDTSEAVDLDGTSSILIYGAQFEEGSFPTSYIKTTGATATRSGDVASIPVADFGFNTDAGSLLVQCQHFTTETGATAAAAVAIDDGSSSNRMWYYQNKGQWIGSSGGATQFSITGGDLAEDTEVKAGMVYSKDDFALYVDGSSVGTDTSGSVAEGVTTLHVGKAGGANVPLNGHIKSIKYYPRRLSNAQLVELTS